VASAWRAGKAPHCELLYLVRRSEKVIVYLADGLEGAITAGFFFFAGLHMVVKGSFGLHQGFGELGNFRL
jgi:rhodanese-related sulfurtransferase